MRLRFLPETIGTKNRLLFKTKENKKIPGWIEKWFY